MDISTTALLLLFLPLCTGVYYLLNPRYRNAVLIIFSLIFYAWFEPVYIWLMLFGVFMNYLFGKMISYSRGGLSAVGFVLGLITNIGMLVVPKYGEALFTGINTAFKTNMEIPQLVLPVGLSFFVLRSISYLIDCRKGRIIAERSIPDFMLYMTMFPFSTAGPVVRYESIEYQLSMRHTGLAEISRGYGRIVFGLAKKLLLADRLWLLAFQFLAGNGNESTVLGSWFGIALYTVCIYFEFSAYADVALGAAGIFGFNAPENFKHPFMSRTVGEFFEKWNISLVSFFRDYTKCGRYIGIIIMWLLMGLWHGPSLTMLMWGLYFGIIIMAEELIGRDRLSRLPAAAAQILSKMLIFLGFSLFCFRDLSLLTEQLRGMFFMDGSLIADERLWNAVKDNILLIASSVICLFPMGSYAEEYIREIRSKKTFCAVRAAAAAVTLLLLVICCSILESGVYQTFLLTLI